MIWYIQTKPKLFSKSTNLKSIMYHHVHVAVELEQIGTNLEV